MKHTPLQRIALGTIRLISAPFRRVAFSALQVLSVRYSHKGMQIVNAAGEAGTPLVPRITEALDLIARYDPKRYARTLHDLRSITLALAGGPEYLHFARTCLIGIDQVQRQSVSRIALAIVHEATHARLSAAGFAGEWHQRARIERICVNQEVVFAQLLPGGSDLASEAMRALQSPWFTEANLFERHIEELRKLGRPEWLLRVYRRMLAPR